eukprot:jgi/Undpi1/12065/HiC_scaffold_4.g01763.m1
MPTPPPTTNSRTCRLALRPRRQQWYSNNLNRRTPPSILTLTVVAVAVVAAARITLAEAAATGRGSVPWWYPFRDWGASSDQKAAGGDGGYVGWAELSHLRHREEARIAREFVAHCVAFGVAEEEERTGEEPQCSIHEATNQTLRRLGTSVDRCASPHYSLAEIHPQQLVFTEVDPEALAAKEAENLRRRKEAAARKAERGRGGDGGDGGGDGGGGGDKDEDDELGQDDVFLGIFLFLKGDFFSAEMENVLKAVVPAYPRAWVVKADAHAFLSFSVQYHLHTFPQLLIFKNGHLLSRYRGGPSPESLAAWLSLETGLGNQLRNYRVPGAQAASCGISLV